MKIIPALSILWLIHSSLLAEITLFSPTDFQVVQRSMRDRGTIRIEGTAEKAELKDSLWEARFLIEGKPTEWHKLDLTVVETRFHSTLDAPAGGWYKLEIRASTAGKVPAERSVEHVGVGEVFVVAGQSNSANHGAEKQRPQSDQVVRYDGSRWQPANDPQPGASGSGGSFMPPFGDAMVAKFNVPIGFVACGIGATSVREWLPSGVLFPAPPTLLGRVRQLPGGEWESNGQAYETMISRMKLLGVEGFRAVLWHQGESDANQKDTTRTLPGKLYREYLTKLIKASRQEIGWAAPWFVAQVSYHVPGDEASADIREAQAAIWNDGIALAGPDSDALKSEWRENEGKGVHFSGPGLREHAARWAAKVAPWLERQLTAVPLGLVLDLDADEQVSLAEDGKVIKWQNLVVDFPARDFVARDEGRAQAGSGRPSLKQRIKELNGHSAIHFRQQELVCMDEDAFDGLTRGSGCTWVAVLAPDEQRVGLKDVNSFFGNLKNSGNFEGLWGCLNDDNSVWWGARNGITFGRFDANNPQLLGPKLIAGRFVIVAGRMAAGAGRVKLDLFVNRGPAVASAEVPVNPKANPSRMAIGQERDAINHPGHESFDGQIARFLIFGRALEDQEMEVELGLLRVRYGLP